MILSVSRRTDIPNYYSEWFFNRIKDGYVYVRNPMNPHQVSRIDITREVVDCIVFWTKNPEPMLGRLDELRGYEFYFQFTLTGYGQDMESNVPHKKQRMIPIFRELSQKAGMQRVIWRYDPILFTRKYTAEYHVKAFKQIAAALNGYTRKCVISFVDRYAKNKKNMELMDVCEIGEAELSEFVKELSAAAKDNGMLIGSCAEAAGLRKYGIEPNCCIDKGLIESLVGCRIQADKDKNQRRECGCVESVDIGAYNTCRNGCKYCYANSGGESVAENCRSHDPESPMLCGKLDQNDRVTERKVRSLKELQMSFPV